MRKSQVLISLAVASMALVASAQAVVIGVDFNNGGAVNQSPASTDVVGPYATAGWNNLVDLKNVPTALWNPYNSSDHGSPLSLKDTTGADTGVKFGFNSYGFSTYNGGSTYSPDYGSVGAANSGLSPNQQLYNGAALASGGGYTQQVTLSNIPFAQYDVYVLAVASGLEGHGLAAVQIFDGGLTQTAPAGTAYWFQSITSGAVPASGFSFVQATGTTQGTATAGANYALFSGLTGSVKTFDIYAPGVPYNEGGYIAGIQIVAVPEPASIMALLGLAGTGLFLRRRQSR